jgi:hypothetical protein
MAPSSRARRVDRERTSRAPPASVLEGASHESQGNLIRIDPGRRRRPAAAPHAPAAILNWASAVSGTASSAARWNPVQVPTASDDLVFTLEADVDDGSLTSTRDDGVTIDDLLYFLFSFEQGC